ncbi:MAG: hypothetical protein KKG01_06800 [Candidatus Omnitrophica bacterium]|nr:hypothetical protein [Candidatus Omnitrophota bacterium]
MLFSEKEFQEIGHCGGQYTVNVKIAPDGRRSFQLGMRHSRPTPASFFAVYFLPQGIPVGMIQLGGIGQSWNPSPVPGSLSIFIASDTQGMFGHQCQNCGGYWRSKASPARWRMTCPYCGLRAESHAFLTDGQLRYAKACCDLIEQALSSDKDGESVVDMDKVADAVGKDCEKPKFYYAEQSQQNKYTCLACSELNDILGRYGYCSSCGTYNGVYELENDLKDIRDKITKGNQYEDCARDAVAAFDSFARQIAKQLAKRIPMTPARQKEWSGKLFHNIKPCADAFKSIFDIDAFKNFKQDEIDFVVLMFHRRHIYEHNGGEVDEKYIRDSGDTSVRVKQVIRESSKTASRIVDLVLRIAQNISEGFHAIFPAEEMPIKFQQSARNMKNTVGV